MHTTTRTAQFNSRRQPAKSWKRGQTMAPTFGGIKLGPVTHTILVALMVTVLGLIYLTQASGVTAYDYQVDKIDDQIATLTTQRADLEVENARLTALENVQRSAVARQMTAPSETNYFNR